MKAKEQKSNTQPKIHPFTALPAMSTAELRQLWQDYYAEEKRLLNAINTSCDTIRKMSKQVVAYTDLRLQITRLLVNKEKGNE